MVVDFEGGGHVSMYLFPNADVAIRRLDHRVCDMKQLGYVSRREQC